MSYCSKDDVIALLGPKAVELRLDDQPNATTAFNRILSYVDQTINRYLDQIYHGPDLVGNEWVRVKATFLAANLLTQRRGNAGLFTEECALIREELTDIQSGNTYIPGAKVHTQFVPSVRTQDVNYNDPYAPLKVNQEYSTGGGYDDENIGPGFAW